MVDVSCTVSFHMLPLIKVNSPSLGSVLAMLLYNGSDSCAAAGESLLMQVTSAVLQNVHVVFSNTGRRNPEDVQAFQHLDKSLLEQILLGMKQARKFVGST